MAFNKKRTGARDDLDAGDIRGKVLDDPIFDKVEVSEEDARSAAEVMAGIAVEKGATSVTHDNELSPCGLDEVIDALFGTIPNSIERPYDGPVERILNIENVTGLRRNFNGT